MTRSLFICLLLGSALLSAGCSKDDESVFTELSVRLVMPDSRAVERLGILSERSYFRNINSYEQIPFPDVENNRASIRLRKGVYTLIVEAEAAYAAGGVELLRNAAHNQTTQALTWVGDAESVVLLLEYVK